jgi:hypothetical protein
MVKQVHHRRLHRRHLLPQVRRLAMRRDGHLWDHLTLSGPPSSIGHPRSPIMLHPATCRLPKAQQTRQLGGSNVCKSKPGSSKNCGNCMRGMLLQLQRSIVYLCSPGLYLILCNLILCSSTSPHSQPTQFAEVAAKIHERADATLPDVAGEGVWAAPGESAASGSQSAGSQSEWAPTAPGETNQDEQDWYSYQQAQWPPAVMEDSVRVISE